MKHLREKHQRAPLLLLAAVASAIWPMISRADVPAQTGQQQPNFIIIFTDDQGYQDLGVFGSPTIKTPNIDRMAKEGRIFTSFYVASPLCSASRAALLTGCYPKRLGMEKPVFFPQDNIGIHKDEVTIADMLKTEGYATACIGKWHLGHRKPFLPTNQGFDSYFGIPYSNDMCHPDNKNRPPYGKWDDYWSDQATAVTQWHTPLMENEDIIELPVDQRTITRRYTDKAIEFITANKDNPFFLYLPHSMPHVPLFVPEDAYDPNPTNAYKTVIEHIDAEVGRVIDTVKGLGLSSRTYILFTSDNGPWLTFKHHAGCADPLRGGKGGTYEGGMRVPCVMWGPGRIPAGTRTDGLATTLDLFPTIARLAGVQATPRGPIDGLDISGLMTGSEPSPRSEFLYYAGKRLEGLRQGDWKILARDDGHKPELYNLAEDISERNNLAEEQPAKLAALKARMQELDAGISADIRPLGVFPGPATDESSSLFDGETLKGWTPRGGKATYAVRNGAIVGTSVLDTPNSFLCTDKLYGDFELEFEVKCGPINSGVQIRSKEDEKGRVNGPQVEIEHSPGQAGFVYGEAMGTGWLSPEPKSSDPVVKQHKRFKNDDWNHYRVVARGPRIRTFINGETVADLTDEQAYASHPTGFIGLQVHRHKVAGVEIEWRKIRIREY